MIKVNLFVSYQGKQVHWGSMLMAAVPRRGDSMGNADFDGEVEWVNWAPIPDESWKPSVHVRATRWDGDSTPPPVDDGR